MPEYREFEAWITCDGQKLCEFHPTQEGKEVSCWVACELGKPFTVHWMDKGSAVQSAGYLILDGTVSAGRFLFGLGSTHRNTVRIDKDTESYLYFAEADSSGRLSGSHPPGLGTIVLKIRQVTLEDDSHSPNPVRTVPKPADVSASTGGACIGFGQPVRTTKQHDQTWKFKPYDPKNPSHYVKFVWRYRTEDFLRKQGIMKAEDSMYIFLDTLVFESVPVHQEADDAGDTMSDHEGIPSPSHVQQCTPPSSPPPTSRGTFAALRNDDNPMVKKRKTSLKRLLTQTADQSIYIGPLTPASSSQGSPQTAGKRRSYYRPHVSKYPSIAPPAAENLSFTSTFYVEGAQPSLIPEPDDPPSD